MSKEGNKAVRRQRTFATIIGLIWFTMVFGIGAAILFVNSIQVQYFPVGTVIAITTTLIAFLFFGYATKRLYPYVRELWRGVEVKANE